MTCRTLAFFLSLLAGSAPAAPGFVAVSVSPAQTVPSGQSVLVTFRLFDYTDLAEIDTVRFDVLWPPELFEFAGGSIQLGDSEGPDQQWLSKPNQESRFEGYELTSFSEVRAPGRLHVHLSDTGAGQSQGGTLASSGFLIAFRLLARGAGTGLIRAVPHDGATGPETFYGTAGTVLGVPQFSSISQSVSPSTRLSIERATAKVIVSWPTNSVTYLLQGRASLSSQNPWSNLAVPPKKTNGLYSVTLPTPFSSFFFRLSQE